MIHIGEYHKILRELQLEEFNGHLLLKNPVEAQIPKVVRSLFDALGDLRSDNHDFCLRKSRVCSFKNCVSPQCYTFVLKPRFKNSLLSREDIEDIANDMDLYRIEEVGVNAYLEEYNRNLPDILKISKRDFRTIYAYMKGNKDADK